MLEEKLAGLKDVTVWPQLYAKASTGKIKTWQIGVTLNDDNTATIWTLHGYIDGKLQLKPKPVKVGKNIGKKNETTPYDQAFSEALSKHKKQIDKKYITEIPTEDNEPDIYLPMLAKKLKESWVKFPCMCQPKLNGVRCMAKKMSPEQVNFTSRKFKSYNETLIHLVEPILPMLVNDEIFDGEVYFYGWTFQQIVRRVKKLREDSHRLQLWVYDIIPIDVTMKASDRNQLYNLRIPPDHPHIVRVPTRIANSMEDIEAFHSENVGLGFEGTIIRNMDAQYKFDYRSADLLKKKDFIDEELPIIGREAEVIAEVDENTGETIERNAIIFICEVPGIGEVKARPRGSIEQRVKWYEDFDNINGKPLTVRYQEKSEDGIPIFPVGIAIRDYE